MRVDMPLLQAAIEDRRHQLGKLAGRDEPLNWVEVAAQMGTYPMLFTRIRRGMTPNDANLQRVATWLGRDLAEFELCTSCPDPDHPQLTYDDPDLPELADDDPDDPDEPEAPDTGRRTAAIVATSGQLSVSEDPETQAAVQRVKELLTEGAVGVSIGADMDPDHMPDKDLLDELIAAEKWDEAEALLADVPFRLRHLAVVDTAAFADARPTLDADGNITGPITFEGIWTGDMRYFPLNSFTWESTLPIPIIWDRQDGDHTGVTVGSITGIERVEGEVSQPDDAVAASLGVAGVDVIPARYVTKPGPGPLTVTPPDANGLRHIYGTAAPTGVCHPNPKYSTQCFTYPGDADPQLRRFHSGMPRLLSDGSTVRLGALTMYGLHASVSAMTKPGVTSSDLAKYEDGRTIFAAVRAYDDPAGLLVAGVVMPDISDADLQRALTMGASVEMAPTRIGRNVIGAHLVPTQAWPVSASGVMTGPEPLVLGTSPAPVPDPAPVPVAASAAPESWDAALASLARIETALALVAGQILDFPEPTDET